MALNFNGPFAPGYIEAYCGDKLVATASVFIVIEVVFVLVSFIASRLSSRQVRREEWLTISALVFNITMCALAISGVKLLYVGRHVQTVNIESLSLFVKMEITFGIIYVLSVTFPKLTILCLFLRIFVNKWHRRTSYALGGIVIATAIANIIVLIAECLPIQYIWKDNLSGGNGHCINEYAFWPWSSMPNIITDIVILILPFPTILKMQMSFKDKIGIALTFFAGSTGLITSILRFVVFIRYTGPDLTWTAVPLCIYSIAEGGVYLIASCLPAYRALYVTIRRPKKSIWTSRGGLNGNSWGFKRYANVEHSEELSLPELPRVHIPTNEDVSERAINVDDIFPKPEGQLPARGSNGGRFDITVQQDFSVEYEDRMRMETDGTRTSEELTTEAHVVSTHQRPVNAIEGAKTVGDFTSGCQLASMGC